MTSQLESNYSISNLTVAELEALITKIVQKVIREEIGNKKVEKETVLRIHCDSFQQI